MSLTVLYPRAFFSLFFCIRIQFTAICGQLLRVTPPLNTLQILLHKHQVPRAKSWHLDMRDCRVLKAWWAFRQVLPSTGLSFPTRESLSQLTLSHLMTTVVNFYCLRLLSLANLFNTVTVAKHLAQLWPFFFFFFASGAIQWALFIPQKKAIKTSYKTVNYMKQVPAGED